MFSSSSRLNVVVAFIWFVGFASVSARLPAEELESLSVIARRVGKRGWIFDGGDVDPCNGQPPWRNSDDSRVVCDANCSAGSNTTCHVTEIYLKRENLNGSLPRELVGLPFLQVIDLSRNYLSGTIPPEWGSMQSLRIISLQGNRVTGEIPKELANITTLEQLILEANQFSGTIPPEFGDFNRIQRLLLNSNYLTGALPQSLAKLTSLEEFRISANNLTGSIPNYIQNWINMTILFIEGSGLTGPIPSNLTSLNKLIDLRISDLNGPGQSRFPELSIEPPMLNVILRSCNIVGEIPDFIGEMQIRNVLDLSFNQLTGQIPPNFERLQASIYLTGNSLHGIVPNRLKFKGNIDLSYNNLTIGSSETYCTKNSPNMFANSRGNTSTGTSFYCTTPRCSPGDYYSFHINCGSNQKVGDYEPDGAESSNFFQSPNSNWGYSSTGKFLNDERIGQQLTVSLNALGFSGPDSVFTDARLSPLSLTYFGLCLRNGDYTVNLQFAEIIFNNGSTYGNLGRRLFDIYIQGNLVKKDYDIANAAGGVYKPWTESFPTIVTDNTMEIRFFWTGKGTTVLPERSAYGPLISAISVIHQDYRPPSSLSPGAIAGIVLGVVFAVVSILGFLWWKGCLGRKHSMYHDLRGLDLRTGSFTLRQIKAATNNFDPANKIGEGGFGPVYKGVLLDGTIIAVKQLSSKSKQGNREFVNEIGMISALQHPHLVKLYGCCIEGNQLLLVYEYMENNSLARALFGPDEYQLHLDWATRHAICIGIARGLAYLHEESRLKIVHRDIKATNVLLDGNLVPKISDFGLAKLDEEDNTHISTRIAGTFGYMAPEYAMRGYLTDKADVYSFGVVLLEIISGRSNSNFRPKGESFYLLDWANSLKANGNLLELIDPRLDSKFNKEEVTQAINVALLCTNALPAERPSMSAVVSVLEGRVGVEKFVSDSSISIDKTKHEEMEMRARDGEGQSVSVDVPWSGSSASAPDLYPVAPDTSYWEKRGM